MCSLVTTAEFLNYHFKFKMNITGFELEFDWFIFILIINVKRKINKCVMGESPCFCSVSASYIDNDLGSLCYGIIQHSFSNICIIAGFKPTKRG